ncbi:MAG: hypothetical protein BWK79_13000 [Beggiatoa sp. IS2]|nr:MAG: hypothetical protein BWK79_13000 [Beggiatoa sp. IS2]
MNPIKPNSSAFLILGMHRSGTSALIRVLNLLGIDIGSQLIPANPANEKGFWELIAIARANEEILQSLHSAWFNPLPLPEQWWQSPLLFWWRRYLTQIIQQNFSKSPLWGIKDPRLCRLLPLWIPLIEELGNPIKSVIIIRHPEEVVASLQARDQLPRHLSLWLWLTYTLEAEYYSRSYPRVFITYQELLQNWQKTVKKIANTLKLTWPNAINSVQSAIDEFLTNELKHHHITTIVDDHELAQWSHEVYQIMTQAAQGHDQSLSLLTTIRENLYHYSQRYKINLTTISQNSDTFYQQWLKKHYAIHVDLPENQNLKIHLLIYLLPEQRDFLKNTLNSLFSQTYAHWQLSVIATFPVTMTEFWNHERLHWICIDSPDFIMKSIHHELDKISADWVSLIYAGDCFNKEFLSIVVHYIGLYPKWRFIYIDEDRLSTDGKCDAPQFKPNFNLDLLRSMPYIGNFCLVERQILQNLGGYFFTQGLENYDIILKIFDFYGETAIGHIPHLLGHHLDQSQLSFTDGKEILKNHLQRHHIQAEIYDTDFTHLYCIDYSLQQNSMISIIIAVCNEVTPLQSCLQSLLSLTDYKNYEILIVTHHRTYSEILTYLKALPPYPCIRVLEFSTETNLATFYHFAAQQAQGEYLLFLNDETQIIQADWLKNLLTHNQRPEIGIVGARLLDAQHRLLQGGLILGLGKMGIAGHVNQELYHDQWGYLGRNQAVQNFSAIADACLMIEKSLYFAVGGMEKSLTLFNDIDLCLKVKQRGYRIVWTPFVTLLQLGIGSVVRNYQKFLDDKMVTQEIAWMYQHWLSELTDDPAYHPSLCLNDHPWQPETQVAIHWGVYTHRHPCRIIAFPYDSWGCGEYRVRAPLRTLQQTGAIEFALMPEDQSGKMPTLTELVRMKPNVILLHNTLHDFQLNTLELYQRFSSSFKIFSQDDLLYALPETHPNYTTQYYDIKQRLHRAIGYCDRLIVTTAPLAEAYRQVINDICIIPNYLEKSRWGHLSSQRRVSRKPRIGWAGAAQHQGDLQLIIPLVKTLAKQVEWVFFGLCLEELRHYIHEFHPMVIFKQYPAKLASLNLDLAIAPLQNHTFNEAKSNLRLLEYGILGWPVICSDIYPYQNAPVTRVKNTDQAWLQAVQEHLSDLEWTAQQGQQLKQWVINGWMLEDHLQEWLKGLQVETS